MHIKKLLWNCLMECLFLKGSQLILNRYFYFIYKKKYLDLFHSIFRTVTYVLKQLKERKKILLYIFDTMESTGFESWISRFESGDVFLPLLMLDYITTMFIPYTRKLTNLRRVKICSLQVWNNFRSRFLQDLQEKSKNKVFVRKSDIKKRTMWGYWFVGKKEIFWISIS